MATEWKKLSLRLRPEVHYTLMQLCPNPTKAIRHLINLYTKSLVDAKFKEVEDFYNSYMQRRASLSATSRQQAEQMILDMEAKATEYQESLFGTDGELMKKRMELIQPIQQRVFDAIERFSMQNGYDLVIDIAANPTVLYYSDKVNFTQRIIDSLK